MFPEYRAKIESISNSIFEKYITIETVWWFTKLVNAINSDIITISNVIRTLTDITKKQKLEWIKELLNKYDKSKKVSDFLNDYNWALSDEEQKIFTNNIFMIFDKWLI